MEKAKIDIGIACSGSQVPVWWMNIMLMLMYTERQGMEIGQIHAISSALPDHNKNHVLYEKKRGQLTDANRQGIVEGFMANDSDWLMQIDDDTVPPVDALIRLLQASREFISGLYFLPAPPHNPIAYMRQPDGTYWPFYNYAKGTMEQVDSVGMGCTLIHKSVFQKIEAAHDVFVRANGSIFAIPKENVRGKHITKNKLKDPVIRDGVLQMEVNPMDADDNRSFPFYALEYGRTEDHHFCELAATVGIRPWLDTTIECEHIKPKSTTVQDYDRTRNEERERKRNENT